MFASVITSKLTPFRDRQNKYRCSRWRDVTESFGAIAL